MAGESPLPETARAMGSKGILAADESGGTMEKRLKSVGVESTLENRNAFRELLFTTPDISGSISAVILFEETLKGSSSEGVSFPALLDEKSIVPGIKVDKGTVKLPGQEVDTFTQGLDDLGKRLAEYRELGARFTKWRAVIAIKPESHPTETAIARNAHDLALFGAISQAEGLVPIIEPEVLIDGSHSIDECATVTGAMLDRVFEELNSYNVSLEGMVLKPNMVTSGSKAEDQASPLVVAQTTLDVLSSTVPSEVPVIAFLSGGQTPEQATIHLNEMNKIKNQNPNLYTWRLTYSFGRALQQEALTEWAQDINSRDMNRAAQVVFSQRARRTHMASEGHLAQAA